MPYKSPLHRILKRGMRPVWMAGLLMGGVLGAVSLYASPVSHPRGWFWYEEAQQSSMKSGAFVGTLRDPDAQMAALHRAENTAFNRLFFEPTEENIRAYMVLQDRVQRRAVEIAAGWQAVLLAYPALDYAQQHPTTYPERMLLSARQRAQEDQAIRRFARRYGLFFFYQSSCPACQAFAPVLRAVQSHYALRVLPIAVGGGPFLPAFPDSVRDRGQAARLHVTVYPSLYAVQPRTHRIVPLAHGGLSEEALRARLVTHITQREWRSGHRKPAQHMGRIPDRLGRG